MQHSRTLRGLLCTGLAGGCLLFPRIPALGDTYEWVDQNGTAGYADSLDSVPAPYRQSARRVTKQGVETFQTVPGAAAPNEPTPTDIQPDPYAPWRDRINAARAELESLKAQRQKAQAEYDALLRPTWIPTLRLFPIDPEKVAQATATVKELEQRIQDKEYEIATTIPDEARQAGVPPRVFDQ